MPQTSSSRSQTLLAVLFLEGLPPPCAFDLIGIEPLSYVLRASLFPLPALSVIRQHLLLVLFVVLLLALKA